MPRLHVQIVLAPLILLIAACASSPAPRNTGSCTLQDAELEQRKTWVRAIVAEHADGLRQQSDGFVLRFRDEAHVKDELDRLVAAERECCSTIQWEVERSTEGRCLLLSVHATTDVRQRLLELFGAEHERLPSF